MNPSEAAIVLTFAAAYDRRTVGEADAKAWALALPHIRVEDARAAIVEYYRESREFLMPSDVGRIVRRQRSDRLRAINAPIPPRELDPYREALWSKVWRDAVMDGSDMATAIFAANASQGVTDDEPLEIEASTPAEIKDRMAEAADAYARAKSLDTQEAAVKAEAYRVAKAARNAEQATTTEGETA